MKSFFKVNLIGEMNTKTQMVLTLVNSAVIILLVYVHIDTGDPTFGQYSHDRFGGGGGEGGAEGGGHGGGGEGGREGGGGDQGWRVEGGQGSRVEVMRVLRKLQAAQVPFLKRYWPTGHSISR